MTNSLSFIEIMLAQSALLKSGHYHGPVDGNLNDSARQAFMDFQKDDGREVTGELDDELVNRLLALRQERVYATNEERLTSRTNSLLKNSPEMRSAILCVLTVGLIVFLYFTA